MKTEQIRNLIFTLNQIATDYDVHEFGLPTHDDNAMADMINAVELAMSSCDITDG